MPLRILQLNSARKYIGEAAHTLNLSEALRHAGHSVWLGLRKDYETFQRAGARKLDPIGFHMPHRWWPPQDLADIRQIARLVREHHIQIVHTHRGKDHWQAVLAVRLSRLKVPVVRTRHVVMPLKAHAANRWLARRTAALVVVSRAVEQDVRGTAMYGDRVRFIPAGIDLDLFAPATAEQKASARARLELSADALVAVCVARFAVVKAHPVLLNAWKSVQQRLPRARLLLVGAGHLMSQAQELAQQLGVSQSVTFLGQRDDVPRILDAADVGVLSSIGSEGFSRAVLEYMAKGLPTVGTRVGAVPDLIEDNLSGMLVPQNDAAALSAALARALAAPEGERQGWGRLARAKAAGAYGYATWAAAHETLYSAVLEQQ